MKTKHIATARQSNIATTLATAAFIAIAALSCATPACGEQQCKATINTSKIINPAISRYLFGINVHYCTNIRMMEYISKWCEVIRWNSGARANDYDWLTHYSNGGPSRGERLAQAISAIRKTFGRDILLIVPLNPRLNEKPAGDIKCLFSVYGGKKINASKHAAGLAKYLFLNNHRKYGPNTPLDKPYTNVIFEVGNESIMEYKNVGGKIYELYSKAFHDYAAAIHKVNRNAKMMGPASISRAVSSPGCLEYFLKTNNTEVDLVSFHRYPRGGHFKNVADCLADIEHIGLYVTQAQNKISKFCSDSPRRKVSDIKVAITEYNAGPCRTCTPKEWIHGVWLASQLGEFMRKNVYIATLWKASGPAGRTIGHRVYASTRSGINVLPSHYVFVFMHEHSHLNDHPQLLDISLDNPKSKLRIYPVKHDKGLSVFIINRSPDQSISLSLDLSGYSKRTKKAAWYSMDKAETPAPQKAKVTSGNFSAVIKPMSINCLEL